MIGEEEGKAAFRTGAELVFSVLCTVHAGFMFINTLIIL